MSPNSIHDTATQNNEIAISSMIILASYFLAQILADIGSLKIASIGKMSFDAGTLIYPFTFTLRDLIHKKLGKKTAQRMIVLCAGANLIMAGFFALVTFLPSDPTWTLQAAFAAVLGPVWRIVLASIAAELISELIDTEVYQLWVTKVTTKHQWARVLVSNAVSVPIDSIIFALIAFSGVLPQETVWLIVWANIAIKGLVTIISIPLIYLV